MQEEEKQSLEYQKKLINEKEKLFSLFFEQVPNGVLFVNAQFKIERVNNKACELFGYKQDILYKNFLSFLHPDDIKQFTNTIETLQESSLPSTRHEMRMIHKDKYTLWTFADIWILQETTSALRFVIQIQNVTKQKMAEQKLETYRDELEYQNEKLKKTQLDLQQTTKRLFRLYQFAPVPYITINRKHEIENLNEKFCDLLGQTKKNLIHKRLSSFVDKESRKEYREKVVTFFNLRQGGKIDLILLDEKKQKIWVNLDCLFFMEEDEAFLPKLRITITDMTQHIVAEQRLKKAKEEAERANKTISEFMANVSHEIRTPLNAIIGFAEILENKLNDKTVYQSYINGIVTGGRSLLALINYILDLSKIDAGKQEIKLKETRVANLIREIVQIFSVKAIEKNIQLHLEIENDFPEMIWIDENILRQILFNVIGNAVKFTLKGFVKIEARIIYHPKKTDLQISVTDTGIGIEKEQQHSIFEPFIQQHDQAMVEGGTGLGLPITTRLLNLLGGTMTLDSEIDKGSVFSFLFPNVKLGYHSPKIQESKEPIIEFDEQKILLVEDMESNRNVFTLFLDDTNLRIDYAINGRQAIEKIAQNKPDLIITDLLMPVLSGYELIEIIRNDRLLDAVPVIVFSAVDEHLASEQIQMPYEGFLMKPIVKKDIIEELKKHLKHKIKGIIETKQIPVRKILNNNKYKSLNKQAKADLLEKIAPLHKKASDLMEVDSILEFAHQTKKFAEQHQLKTLDSYAQQLLENTELFLFDKINQALDDFNIYIIECINT